MHKEAHRLKKKSIIFIMILLMLIGNDASRKAIVVEAGSDVSNTTFMEIPPFDYYISEDAKNTENDSIKLKLKSSKANKIIDDEDWFKKNKLSLKTYQVPNSYRNISGNLPEGIDVTWDDLIITSTFYDSSYIYCTYGSDFSEGYILNVYDSDTLEMEYSLNFSDYRYSPKYIKADYDFIQQKILWATIKDDILYISHAHSTYAKSSKNMNAYITAIDLTNMSILWRSKALLCNSYNFIIIDGVIICGYGFTDERDYLYQVDMNTGKVLSKTSLKSAVSYIVKKGNSLYVRTYNTDYIFNIIQ